MRLLSIAMALLLTSCNSFVHHKDELKPMAHDMVDEEIEAMANEIKAEVKHDPAHTQ